MLALSPARRLTETLELRSRPHFIAGAASSAETRYTGCSRRPKKVRPAVAIAGSLERVTTEAGNTRR